MNKTVNINLGGLFFHIDEDAFQKLNRYFDAIKRSLSNSSGQDEIMKDIEMRISEIFTENKEADKQVINLKDVDAMIAVMGQPEDYRIEEEGEATQTNYNSSTKTSKKLYRDIDKNILGGVSAGLGHYFGIDALWIRLALVLIVIAGVGFPILLYILLWILIPKAQTTTEKLQMTGEPVNLSNIEKKVREEFASFSERVENANYEKMGNETKSGAEKVASAIGEVFMTIFTIFAKFIGAIILMLSIFMLGAVLIGGFTFGSTTFVDMPWQSYYDAVIVSEFPIWLVVILSVLAIGIPFFFLLILGLKLLITNMKSIGNVAKYTLLALWLIAVGILISFGIKQATEIAYNGKTVQKETLNLMPNDTLDIQFKFNDYYAKDFHYNDFEVTQDENGNDIIYSNQISIELIYTDEAQPYLQIEKRAEGKSITEAKKRAEKINYAFKFEGNKLILDNYFITDLKNKYRNQEVELYLYLPQGTILRPDSNVQSFDSSNNGFFNLHYSSEDYIYKVTKEQIKCLNCPIAENEYNDVETDATEDSVTSTVTISTDGIHIKETNKAEEKRKFKGLEINKEGVIIKTN
ncbi:PspC domain-containing protein [Flavobacterium lacus]|uniref:Phage shock protein C (PspC) family protein n=1 Tax=Flavobacterium lacus TaxID=1353778 RepID=A0A328WKW8_9FLAO|nr:PspC domain-containing protein [Flavobacterium lacus]RAR46860.1 phage shock protein C (PspC) family protein [Flavobacterium lacus]